MSVLSALYIFTFVSNYTAVSHALMVDRSSKLCFSLYGLDNQQADVYGAIVRY